MRGILGGRESCTFSLLFVPLSSCYSIALSKLDVLDTFDEIKIGVAYKLNGKNLESFPGS